MKKRDKKLQLHRETVVRLTGQLDAVRGGLLAAQQQVGTGFQTSCIEPNCCGSIGTIDGTQ